MNLICGESEGKIISHIFFFEFYFIFKLYITVLVLPNIKMNPPQVYRVQDGEHMYFSHLKLL